MPNACLNELTVTGPKEELDRFLSAARGTRNGEDMPLRLQSLFPIPEHLDTGMPVDVQSGEETWYSWCIENWGTKWDVMDFLRCSREADDRFFLAFETANGPCDEAFSRRIAPDFPALTFVLHYSEPSCLLAGECEWRGGKLVREEE